MKRLTQINSDKKTETDGSIDFKYYQQRAHEIRSTAIIDFFRSLFYDKKNSFQADPHQLQVSDC